MSTGRSQSISAGVIGATGTTGVELARLLTAHPSLQLRFATSRERAGQTLSAVDPAAPPLLLSDPDEIDPTEVDVVFLCLPHGSSALIAAEMRAQGARVIDLSGDLRLTDAEAHSRTYGSERSQELAEQAVYGLPELNREEIRRARLVSNPGCYATAVTLALLPLAEAGKLESLVIVDAKSGVSGAGRAATATTHFCSAHDDVRPYKAGRAHRHVPEMEQTLTRAMGSRPQGMLEPVNDFAIIFTPHLVPLERGILATCVVRDTGLDSSAASRLYQERYAREPMVRVQRNGEPARIRTVARSNRAVVSIDHVQGYDLLVITCAIDNLGKGAAGQAIQNANLFLGLPETEGINLS
jgi:N-acetyl-gamma-glutamyl-phosphate reductase